MAQVGAFDAHRPPAKDLVDVCVHCGFCLPTCPTYLLGNEEMDSPRGRIVLMNLALEEADELSESMVTHWDRCLGCMACVTACPSGVRYDKLIEATRPQVERNHQRLPGDRAFRRFAYETFTHPGRLRALVPLLAGARRLGLTRASERWLTRFPRMRALQSLLPDVTVKAAAARLPETSPAQGQCRARVGMLLGCVQRVFFDDVNQATARVLAAEGFEVFAPRSVRCCGALMLHSGAEAEALELAKKMIEAFEDCDYVAVNAAGCGSSMKDYGDLLSDDEDWAERAKRFSDRVRDVSQLLAEHEPVATRHPVPLKVAYHDACHLAHAQQVRSEPRTLLRAIPDLDLVDPSEWEICCGSAGIYNILQPDAGAALGRRKAENLLATDAEAIVSGNPGCTLQITAHLRDQGHPLPIYHPVQLLDRSIRGVGRP
jgi:glycolate oxidase iron-sulfur subunit